ncbi:ZIP Zinc transporter [Phlyctema vagabunda]|uniref:ZIP Zinc transporter n=1 Tax=Phlyctema vagabunda TaxID=108571 RepID=A0ABR4PPJ6_9HELO
MTDNRYAEARSPSWSGIPTELLLAELARRDAAEPSTKPECGSGVKGSYNTPAHVFALVLILALSTIACGFPLISRRSSKSAGPGRFIFISQHFGTGVLIATAFVHLLPTAFTSLTDPCLPYFFSEGYNPLAGLIAMFSALIVVGLEMFLTTRGAGHSHSHGGPWDAVPDEEGEGEGHSHASHSSNVPPIKQKKGRLGTMGLNHRPADISLGDLDASEGLVAGASPLPASTPVPNGNGSEQRKYYDRDEDNDSDLDLDELDPSAPTLLNNQEDVEATIQEPTSTVFSPEEEQKRQILQCLLLEAGILFHSIFIGMAVSVATGPPFVVFLIAICFHQSFEGLALGSRIAAINFPKSSPRPWLMVLAYGTTTPIGQAIGLVVHNLYDPQSAAGLLMVGIMNAISSGLLLFAGLVQLLAADFLSDKSYVVLKGRRRWEAFGSVLGGAVLMAFVGAWA